MIGTVPAPVRRVFDRLPDAEAAARLLEPLRRAPRHAGPRRVDRPLALYGAGNLGRMAYDYFRAIGIPVAAVFDRDADALAADPFWRDLPPKRPEAATDAQRRGMLLAVATVTSPYAPLAEALAGQGWRDVAPVYDVTEAYRDRHPLSNGWFADPLDAQEAAAMADLLRRLDDDLSRAHHLQTLAWRILREEWSFPGGVADPAGRFLTPEVMAALPASVEFLDLGAHVGAVSERLIGAVGARCRNICAVEPDPAHLAALSRALGRRGAAHRICRRPLAAEPGPARFRAGLGYASQLTEQGDVAVATTIDALDASPDFVKLHLEGGELAALNGGRSTLERTQPIVAATSYHNADGMRDLPAWLMDALPGHDVTIRLHGWCGTGAVVYAVPRAQRRAAHRSPGARHG